MMTLEEWLRQQPSEYSSISIQRRESDFRVWMPGLRGAQGTGKTIEDAVADLCDDAYELLEETA